VAIINLDVKDYFHSVRLNEEDYLLGAEKEKCPLSIFLFEISKKYHQELPFLDPHSSSDGYVLPIGLISSSILGNYYLSGFDKLVLEKTNPSFYGRYVDDILIVKRVNKKLKNETDINRHIKDIIKTFAEKGEDEKTWVLKMLSAEGKERVYKEMAFQPSKMNINYFDSNEPTILIDKFEKELIRNRNAFRYFSSDDSSLMEHAYSMTYDGSRNKLSSIKEFTTDSFGLATYLARLIFKSLSFNEKQNPKTSEELLSFFKHQRALKFYAFWERVFVFFVVSRDSRSFGTLIDNISTAIEKVSSKLVDATVGSEVERKCRENKDANVLKATLEDYLKKSVESALSLNLNFPLDNSLFKTAKARALINSNMVRHMYTALPLISNIDRSETLDFTRPKYSNDEVNLFEDKESNINLHLRGNFFCFPPRFVHFEELAVYSFKVSLFILKEGGLRKTLASYLDIAFNLLYAINTKNQALSEIDKTQFSDEKYLEYREKYFNDDFKRIIKEEDRSNSKESCKTDNDFFIKYTFTEPRSKKISKPKIAVANLQLRDEEIYHSLIDRSVLSRDRKSRLFQIIDQTIAAKNVNFLVLPELSVPYQWINLISAKVRREEIFTIFGAEYLIINQNAYNLIVNLIPIKIAINMAEDNYFTAVIPLIRVKNHYAPSEIEELTGYHLEIPKMGTSLYYLTIWRGVHFTTFNCFELTDITERGAFRSLVDVIFACEYNKDISHFSNIIESASRDVHCYIVQANSANYGDSRITQSTKTVYKDILRAKGGVNPTVLVDYIGSTLKLKPHQDCRGVEVLKRA